VRRLFFFKKRINQSQALQHCISQETIEGHRAQAVPEPPIALSVAAQMYAGMAVALRTSRSHGRMLSHLSLTAIGVVIPYSCVNPFVSLASERAMRSGTPKCGSF
jgi:hypothetical protein